MSDVAINQKKAHNRLKLNTIEISLFRPDQRCFKGKERHKQRNELGEYVSGFGLQPQFYRLETEYAKQQHLVHKLGKETRKADQGTG